MPTPEMAALGARYGFRIKAHKKGDANRKARVERDFDFIQRNFPKRRTFQDDDDLNRQAEEWCRHESPETTRVYLNASLRLKERALERTRPKARGAVGFRYKPSDRLMAFLEGL